MLFIKYYYQLQDTKITLFVLSAVAAIHRIYEGWEHFDSHLGSVRIISSCVSKNIFTYALHGSGIAGGRRHFFQVNLYV